MIPASGAPVLALLLGGIAGAGGFLLIAALRGLPPSAPGRPGRLRVVIREVAGARGLVALAAGLAALLVTGWLVAGIGIALLVLSWHGLSGAAGERRAMARLEALALWAESLRDSIAGASGLEQAIPSSLRAASPVIAAPLAQLVDRLHVRVPMAEALAGLADDLDDASADLVIAALILNARLRGPGLRDMLTSLATSVREDLDMRRKIYADRRSTRRSVQIVVAVSVGMAIGLAVFNHSFLSPYDGPAGQALLALVACIYAAGIVWLRRLATFEAPQRLLDADVAGRVPGGTA